MRIIQFTQSLRTGGAETIATNYAISLNNISDNNVQLMVYDGFFEHTPNEKRLNDAGIPIFFVSDRSKWYYKTNDIIAKIIRLEIRDNNALLYIKKHNPDVIHFHSTPFELIEKISKRFPSIKLFYTVHTEVKRNFKDQRNFELAKKMISSGKITLIALHEQMRKDCNQIFGIDNTVVINNGIDCDGIRKAGKFRDRYRKQLGFSKCDLVIGHVGSFSPVKNHGYLLEIFKDVCEKRKSSRLLLIGSGNLKEKLQERAEELGISDKITWLENRVDIPELLSTMDVFVFPSLYEGLPLSVLEAEAAGLRVLMSSTITDQVLLTPNIKKMDIKSDPTVWAEEILHPTSYHNYSGLEAYDMRNVAKKVMRLYQGDLK